MGGFKDFWSNFKGAIIGIIVAIIVIATGLHQLILGIVFVVLGAFIGNYIQQNKQIVKDRLKNFIDRF